MRLLWTISNPIFQRSATLVRTRKSSPVKALSAVLPDKMAQQDVPEVTEVPLMCYNWMCPYVHRLSLALAHKQALDSIKRVDIDLANKPAWLPKFSPHGKVPAVTYTENGQQQVLYESLVLLQWVEDYYKGPELLPGSPAQKAKGRIIISRFDGAAVSRWYQMVRCSEESNFSELMRGMKAEFAWLESSMDPTGPFMMGSTPTMVDAACAPWFLRLCVFQKVKNVDLLAGFPRLQKWLAAYKSHPDVVKTIKPPPNVDWEQGMIDIYGEKYAGGFKDMSKAAAQA
ncbi:glutathione S-transferase [Dunaliella salina]|uniref:Glutathione S-transferase n=1 Tax=Dunaliella salina TaxID=3046 RepID=A0ABQ7G3T1_DUNSA|nr:glutathione S-transferase [Dunaliella salina]|eukprot:KAF5829268.1 glutathione S-transferase [Dunaliella salina]